MLIEQVGSMTVRHRGTILLAIVLLVLASGVHYDAREEHHREGPTDDQLLSNYDGHVGERTLLFGTVESVDADRETATIRVGGSRIVRLQVNEFDADVSTGGSVQVYGTIRPNRAVDADTVVVVNRTPGALYYKYAVSAVGALGILAAFFRDWRIDWSNPAFVPRGEDDG
jgi:hypothetical protein